jgi:hypothetical protein
MKKTLQFFFIGICIFANHQNLQAQATVSVNGSSNWLGYANVFQTNGTSFLFGSAWGLPDLKTTLTASTNTIKLQPNFNTYANATSPADIAYWTNGAGLGNKIFEGNSYVENSSLAGQIVTFNGNVTNHNLASGYTAVAFIKGLNPANNYSTDFSVTLPLTTTGAFSLSSVTAIPAGLIVQYGFTIKGLNGNPANETALGNVTVVGTNAPATPVNVTFKVDMTQQTGFTTPEVNGTFNAWCGNCNPMTDANSDGIWETTLSLVPGSYEYKFSRDNWAGQESLTSGSSCTVTNGSNTNRTLLVGNQNMVLPIVCWASCSTCGTVTPVTEPMTAAPTPTIPAANVISMFSNPYTNVPVNTWQATWSQGALASVQIQGNDTKKYTNLNFVGVEATSSQINATNMLFFHVDAWTPNMTQLRIKLVDFGANAAYGGGDDVEHELTFTPTLSAWNSYHIPLSNFTGLVTKGHIAQLIFAGQPVGAGTLYVDNVYFTTVALSNQSFEMANISMFPNPVSDMLTITSATEMDAISIYNVIGQEVLNVNVNADNKVLNVSSLEDGIYLVKVISGGKISTSKFIKQ